MKTAKAATTPGRSDANAVAGNKSVFGIASVGLAPHHYEDGVCSYSMKEAFRLRESRVVAMRHKPIDSDIGIDAASGWGAGAPFGWEEAVFGVSASS